jgi:hypothetical protein
MSHCLSIMKAFQFERQLKINVKLEYFRRESDFDLIVRGSSTFLYNNKILITCAK